MPQRESIWLYSRTGAVLSYVRRLRSRPFDLILLQLAVQRGLSNPPGAGGRLLISPRLVQGAFPCFALYSTLNCSNPSLCEPAKTVSFAVPISPVKVLRSASWSTRFQEPPLFEETYRPPSRSLTTQIPG